MTKLTDSKRVCLLPEQKPRPTAVPHHGGRPPSPRTHGEGKSSLKSAGRVANARGFVGMPLSYLALSRRRKHAAAHATPGATNRAILNSRRRAFRSVSASIRILSREGCRPPEGYETIVTRSKRRWHDLVPTIVQKAGLHSRPIYGVRADRPRSNFSSSDRSSRNVSPFDARVSRHSR